MINLEKQAAKIKAAPLNTFTQLTVEKDQTSIIYKFDTPLFEEEIAAKSNKKFPLFELNGLSSLNIMFAYLFTFPFKNFDLKEKYFIIRRPSSQNLTSYTGVELIYPSQYINVYNSGDGACLITANGLNKVILTEIVRKSKKVK